MAGRQWSRNGEEEWEQGVGGNTQRIQTREPPRPRAVGRACGSRVGVWPAAVTVIRGLAYTICNYQLDSRRPATPGHYPQSASEAR